jgi:predicted pyridoxine 5'-phosphate oxidase superfamily flavin-nucleotide-binding protein
MKLTAEVQRFVEGIPVAFVASVDETGRPHLAAGKELKVLDGEHIVFENWFCHTTLGNVARNPQVAVAVTVPDSGTGYQFVGTVSLAEDAAILDGYVPEAEAPGTPQTLTRMVVRVAEVYAFSAGIHTDRPVGR